MSAGMTAIPRVDPLRFPLMGSHLIEASAGTGKTWTIAALYVRLVLGHGGQPPRLPADILVLTFTDAAAQELRERIRARLSEAAAAFGGDTADELEDPFLRGLLGDCPRDTWGGRARLLDLAAQSMDEAAISTIHAWSNRVLQEHAFDSGSLFEQRLETDLGAQMEMVAWDYWRRFVGPLDELLLERVLKVWSGPDRLLAALAPHLTREALVTDERPLAEVLGDYLSDRRARIQALKAPWVEGAATLDSWLSDLGKAWKVRPSDRSRWIRALSDWAGDPAHEDLDLKTGWERLSPGGMAEKWAGEGPVPEHPLCARLSDLREALKRLPDVRGPLLRHALGWMGERLRAVLSDAAMLGFDGLLEGLDRALCNEQGHPLAERLRRQFPVALIDEFQDTDPVQYRIFDHIYRVADNDQDTAILFIGDPKQSIYRFRGADVHTYLRAARACTGRVQTLDTNYRSSSAMVEAVNLLFLSGVAPVFPTGQEGEAIEFHPVHARGREETWERGGARQAALSATWLASPEDGKPLALGAYERQASEACAQRVAAILNEGLRGAAGMRGSDGVLPVRPVDIAVLVNTHAEAHSVRGALASEGIRSVYLSERDSVYETPVANEMALWLNACMQPENERTVRAALGTPSLGMEWAELDCLMRDEHAWDLQVERFQTYRACWRQRGVLPAIRRLLHDFAVPARLLSRGQEGERELTDLLHLADLLQQASVHLDGERAVLRYLHTQCQSRAGDDAQRLRLESDEDLVRVITVHKSKGLEYPLVFLPFGCRARSVKETDGPFLVPGPNGREWLMAPTADQARRLERERLGEDVRKLYVALTRARHAVWLALGPTASFAESGLGHILGDNPQQAWDALARGNPALVAWDESLPEAGGEVKGLESASGPALGPARELRSAAVAGHWWIASYSALNLAHAGLAPETAEEDLLRETQRLAVLEFPERRADVVEPSGLDNFPRGGEAGTFLHGLLEWAAQRRFRQLDGARDLIARRCAVRGWEAHIDALHDWLMAFTRIVWRPDFPEMPEIIFGKLDVCLPEMEFWLPVSQLDIQRLDDVIVSHTFGGLERPGLSEGRMNGMFKGFIDLSLCAGERYYIVDYKSNDLGDGAEAYGRKALVGAALRARYDVQMLMYVLALHRQLRARLPDYQYERHMGGAVYMFLRGAGAPGQGLLAFRPERGLIDALEALFDGGRDSHA